MQLSCLELNFFASTNRWTGMLPLPGGFRSKIRREERFCASVLPSAGTDKEETSRKMLHELFCRRKRKSLLLLRPLPRMALRRMFKSPRSPEDQQRPRRADIGRCLRLSRPPVLSFSRRPRRFTLLRILFHVGLQRMSENNYTRRSYVGCNRLEKVDRERRVIVTHRKSSRDETRSVQAARYFGEAYRRL